MAPASVGGADSHVRVVVRTLPGQHFPSVESGRGCLQVPLAEYRRLVPGRLQELRKRLLGSVEPQSVVENSVQMAVLAGQDHGPARSANRVRHQSPVEPHPLSGDPIQVGRVVDHRAVCAERLIGMIVRENEEDVGPFLSRWEQRRDSKQQGS